MHLPLYFHTSLLFTAGNSWGTDANGTACVGCGPQEQFYGCADIAIERRDDVISHTTTSAVWCTNSTWLPEPTKVTSEDRVSSSSSHTTVASWLFAALASLPPPWLFSTGQKLESLSKVTRPLVKLWRNSIDICRHYRSVSLNWFPARLTESLTREGYIEELGINIRRYLIK